MAANKGTDALMPATILCDPFGQQFDYICDTNSVSCITRSDLLSQNACFREPVALQEVNSLCIQALVAIVFRHARCGKVLCTLEHLRWIVQDSH